MYKRNLSEKIQNPINLPAQFYFWRQQTIFWIRVRQESVCWRILKIGTSIEHRINRLIKTSDLVFRSYFLLSKTNWFSFIVLMPKESDKNLLDSVLSYVLHFRLSFRIDVLENGFIVWKENEIFSFIILESPLFFFPRMKN